MGGARLRDVRSGLSVPPSLTWRTFLNGAMRPLWLYDFLTTPPPSFATLGQAPVQGGSTMQLGTAVAAASLPVESTVTGFVVGVARGGRYGVPLLSIASHN